jgi:hypothetical protein
MRYTKGSLSLNQSKDKAILRFVADSRYVTHSQLFDFTTLDCPELNRKVFNWRIGRLVRKGLVRKHVLPILNGEPLYSIRRSGVQALEQLGTYYLGGALEREKDPHEFQIPHALEVTNIRLALLRTQTLWSWTPETFIRVLNLSPSNAYAKVYDGIARVRLDGRYLEFAVEYERTLKSPTKYEKIREAIESETRLKAFLYIVPTSELLYSLVHEFQGTKQLILFGLGSVFKQDVLRATVLRTNYARTSLQAALLNVAPRAVVSE